MTRLLPAKRFALFLICCLVCTCCFSQVTGIWRGYFISDGGDQYKLEFQVKQTSGKLAVSGVSYSYLDKRFYGKATMTGNYMADSKNFRIREIKTVEVKNMGGGGTCIMNYNLVYTRSGKEEFLEGTYLGKQETSDTSDHYKWGDCGGGKVYLRRVVESDFYVEPFLRNTTPPVAKTDVPVKTTPPPKTPVTKPVVAPPAVTKPPVKQPVSKTTSPVKKPVTKPPVAKTNPPVKTPVTKPPVKDTTLKTPVIVQTQVKSPVKTLVNTPAILRTRQNELMKALVVNSGSVEVKLYDNGEIDDDSISVFYDKRLLRSNQRLSTSPIVIHLDLPDDGQDHELVMVAENLGRIPPNTSLMIVEAGEQRFEVRITSNEQKNAVVRFRYQKP